MYLTNLKPSCRGNGARWAKFGTQLFFDSICPPELLVNVSQVISVLGHVGYAPDGLVRTLLMSKRSNAAGLDRKIRFGT